jgi:hypothetical protein
MREIKRNHSYSNFAPYPVKLSHNFRSIWPGNKAFACACRTIAIHVALKSACTIGIYENCYMSVYIRLSNGSLITE